ncbi:MAG: ornithine carbamoyltransferase [Rickettsiales bacterium]
MVRHFLDFSSISADDLRHIVDKAVMLKAERKNGKFSAQLANKKLAMIFEKNSTRTRISFEVAMLELGGNAIYLSGSELQLGRGETVSDTAKVISRYVDAIMLRCHSHDKLLELAENSTIPVINGLTEFSHPCQIIADIITFEENLGNINSKKIAWVGDGNNVAQSWIQAAVSFGYSLTLACPEEFAPIPEVVNLAKKQGADIKVVTSPEEAVAGADAVITDTWVSMGDEDSERRVNILSSYQVNTELMKQAKNEAIFLHCLPAHRGEEVTDEVIDSLESKVFDEAENRLHAQKSIILWCFGLI